MNAPINLHELRTAWVLAKEREAQAREERLSIEKVIAVLMPAEKPEGTVSDKDSGIAVKYSINRKVDSDALSAEWTSLPSKVQAAFKWSADVSLPALRELDGYDALAASKFITAKPAKPSVTIKETKE